MKKTIMSFAVSCTLAVGLHAAIIQGGSVVNLDGSSPDTLILGSSGTALASGFYGVGYFNLTDSQITTLVTASDFTSLNAAFQVIASDNFSTGVPFLLGVGATPGLAAIGNDNFNPTAAIGRSLYTYITNSAALGGSSSYGLYKHTSVFVADPANPPPNTYTAALSGGSLLVGSFDGSKVANVTDVGSVTFQQSLKLSGAVIPEPSAALLGAIGALGLLRRRRN